MQLTDGTLAVPGLFTETSKGFELAKKRRAFFEKTLPTELMVHYDAWLGILERMREQAHLQLDPGELALLLETEELESWLSEAVRALDGETEFMPALFDSSSIEYDHSAQRVTRYDENNVPYFLYGATWE
jgi:hypothetical protein